jgi:hypothetical protein
MVHQLEKEKYVYRSTIYTDLLILTLKRGAILGGSGALLLVLGGTILPLEMLSLWGIPFFLVGLFFIGIGWLPFRQLSKLQIKPHEIHYDGSFLIFLKQGTPLFKIASISINKISYVKREHLYGLGIWLKKPIEKKVQVLQSHFNFAAFMSDSIHSFEGCDLFLPFFSEYSCKELAEVSTISSVSKPVID